MLPLLPVPDQTRTEGSELSGGHQQAGVHRDTLTWEMLAERDETACVLLAALRHRPPSQTARAGGDEDHLNRAREYEGRGMRRSAPGKTVLLLEPAQSALRRRWAAWAALREAEVL